MPSPLLYDEGGAISPVPIDLLGAIGGGMTSSDEGWAPFTDEWIYRNIYDTDGNKTGTDSTWVTNYIVPEGYYWIPWTENHSLVRKPSVKQGITQNPAAFNVTTQWDTVPGGADQWDSLGFHTCDCATANAVTVNQSAPKAYVFPNPATENHFTVSTNSPVREIELVNMLGQTILSKKNTNGELNIRVDVPANKEGLYFVRLKFTNNDIITKKLMIR